MKRFLSILTAAVLCICMLTTTLSATEPIASSGLNKHYQVTNTWSGTGRYVASGNSKYIGYYVSSNGSIYFGASKGQYSSVVKYAYGIYIENGGTVTIIGGTYSSNYCGIYVGGSGSTLAISGATVISGNSYTSGTDTVNCNVYLDDGALITLGELTSGASIGVTTNTKPTAGNPVQITTSELGNNTEYYKTALNYFFSDDPDYEIRINETGGYLELSVYDYDVTADQSIENGSISLGSSSAVAGDTVSFTVVPNAGYAVGEVTVTSASGPVSVTESNGVYSFVMPAEAVTINAVFYKASSGVTGTIYVNEQYHGIFINGHLACIPHTIDENGYCTVCREYIGMTAEEETTEEAEAVEETVEIVDPVEGVRTDTELDG
ncbi:MAG: hypothetical protein LUG86_04245 [Oscillospiraceae bacterium]|nr:hypothetical protein [Oscillospiraceae bacterium]